MTAMCSLLTRLAGVLPRAALVAAAIASAPVSAMSGTADDGSSFIGGDMKMASGAGLVLVVSLQRAQ